MQSQPTDDRTRYRQLRLDIGPDWAYESAPSAQWPAGNPPGDLPATSAHRDDSRALPWAGYCPVHCLGTMRCLCGQQELSDSPLWIENDIPPFRP